MAMCDTMEYAPAEGRPSPLALPPSTHHDSMDDNEVEAAAEHLTPPFGTVRENEGVQWLRAVSTGNEVTVAALLAAAAAAAAVPCTACVPWEGEMHTIVYVAACAAHRMNPCGPEVFAPYLRILHAVLASGCRLTAEEDAVLRSEQETGVRFPSRVVGVGAFGVVVSPPLPVLPPHEVARACTAQLVAAAAAPTDAHRVALVGKVFASRAEAEAEIASAAPFVAVDPEHAFGFYPLGTPLRPVRSSQLPAATLRTLQEYAAPTARAGKHAHILQSPTAHMVLERRADADWFAWAHALPAATTADLAASLRLVGSLWRHLWSGLQTYHAAGLAHMDVRMENVGLLAVCTSDNSDVDLTPTAKFLDFGLAVRVDDVASTTSPDARRIIFDAALNDREWIPLRLNLGARELLPRTTGTDDDEAAATAAALEAAVARHAAAMTSVGSFLLQSHVWREDARTTLRDVRAQRRMLTPEVWRRWAVRALWQSTDIFQLGFLCMQTLHVLTVSRQGVGALPSRLTPDVARDSAVLHGLLSPLQAAMKWRMHACNVTAAWGLFVVALDSAIHTLENHAIEQGTL